MANAMLGKILDLYKEGKIDADEAEQMLRGLTPEDIAVCKRIFQQVCSNAEACIKQKG